MENLISKLQSLGFTQYEAKAYITLLKNNPVTGYELSKRSGVPRSMIYETLNRLLDKGIIYSMHTDPIKYIPVSPEELFRQMRCSFEESVNYLQKELESLTSFKDVNLIWNIKGYDNMINKINDLINQAQNEMFLSLWNEHIPAIQDMIVGAEKRKIKIYSVIYGGKVEKLGFTAHHSTFPSISIDAVEKRLGGKLIIVAKDKEEVLIGNIIPGGESWGIITKDPTLVMVAEEYIKHDIAIERLAREVGYEKLKQMINKTPNLLDMFAV